jgi:hypothetical protein
MNGVERKSSDNHFSRLSGLKNKLHSRSLEKPPEKNSLTPTSEQAAEEKNEISKKSRFLFMSYQDDNFRVSLYFKAIAK